MCVYVCVRVFFLFGWLGWWLCWLFVGGGCLCFVACGVWLDVVLCNSWVCGFFLDGGWLCFDARVLQLWYVRVMLT